jgi:tat pathway signal sequence domain protein
MNKIKPLTRRSALGLIAAAGGATFLAACGSQSQAPSGSSSVAGSASASAAASKTARTDYSGVAVLEGYTSKPSDYQPATRTEPSKNAPVPVKPAVANENSVEGLYQSIAFFGAAMEYYMRTGKTEPLRESALDNSELKSMLEPEKGTLGDGMQQGKIWMQDPSATITMLTAQPERDGDAYDWDIRLTMDTGEFIASKDRVENASSDSDRKNDVERTLHGVYENGAWKLTGMRTSSSSSSSASASASDS